MKENEKQVIATANAPAAIGPYSQGILTPQGLLFISGQIPVNPATGEVLTEIKAATEQIMKNLGAILAAAGKSYDNVVKTTVFLADIKDFAAMNEVYASYFKGACPARSAVQVASLPKGVLLEIEAIAC